MSYPGALAAPANALASVRNVAAASGIRTAPLAMQARDDYGSNVKLAVRDREVSPAALRAVAVRR